MTTVVVIKGKLLFLTSQFYVGNKQEEHEMCTHLFILALKQILGICINRCP